MKAIKLLSNSTINKIAAGEVIDRPFAVVKELIENSLDAASTTIHISMKRGGRTEITVNDDGCGIRSEELQLAISRHTTSKLYDEDINNILYMGFRGEALAAIATAGKVSLTSRTHDSHCGYSIDVVDNLISLAQPKAHNVGTTVTVQNLFYSLPNRLRFLKSEMFETISCTELIKAFAIAYPNIKFTFEHNDKLIIDTIHNTLEQRVGMILGNDFLENSLYFDTGINYKYLHNIKLCGYIAIPTHNRTKQYTNFTYVNKRLVKDKLLNKLIKAAYSNTIPDNIQPSVVLFLDLPIQCVDVNIHPNKSEVRFNDENIIRDIVIQTIKDILYNTKTTNKIPQKIVQDHNQYKQLNFDTLSDNNHDRNNTLNSVYLGIPQFQLNAQYVIAENTKGIVIIDQHAAHERIVLEQLNKEKISIQYLAIPITITHNDLLLSLADSLQAVGINITTDDMTIYIHSIPALPGGLDVVSLIDDILADPIQISETINNYTNQILRKIACHSSIRAGRELNFEEMNNLLRLIENTAFSSQCVHGRPTYIELPRNYLDKMFERT